MVRYFTWISLLLIQSGLGSLSAQPESYYVQQIAALMQGQTEVVVPNGRVDILTDNFAIEVERAANWKHAIGQSLWYGMQTNKQPGIVLIIQNIEERKHGIRLQSALDYAGIGDKVRVWLYPEDFNLTFEGAQEKFKEEESAKSHVSDYWLTTNSNVRHNNRCRWYANSKGKYCSNKEGKPCGICGG